MVVEQPVISGQGEDSFTQAGLPHRAMLCVADGCGGLGSRRYERKNNRTGAYLASRLAVTIIEKWAQAEPVYPSDLPGTRSSLQRLQLAFDAAFRSCARELCANDGPSRIVGSMQRVLPTTLCALLAEGRQGLFLWAGDSRGYTLDGGGLHQYTSDDVRGCPDAFEGLLLDRPLSNLISADREVRLNARGFALPERGLLLCATDGVYGAVSSPMELEMLLLDTLLHSPDATVWQHRLRRRLAARMQDDSTLLCCPCGFTDFRQMQRYFRARYMALKKEYIRPMQHLRHDREAVRGLWQRYRISYERMEGMDDERKDWRV